MELRQLKYFLKTRELLSFTEAARSLYITQSTLSQQIRQLEIELDVPLFNRTGKRIVITEAGELFAAYAAESVKRANDGLLLLKDLNGLKTGTITIGVTYGLRHVFVQALIQFGIAYPQINVRVMYGTSEGLIEKLREFRLDFILVFNEIESDSQLSYQSLFSSPLTLVTSENSLFSGKATVTLKEISELPLAIATQVYSGDHYFERMFSTHGLSPQFSIEINDIPSILDLVKTGKWNTIMVQTSVYGQGLLTIPLKEKGMRRTAMIISLKEAYEKKAAKKFLNFLLNLKAEY